MTRLVTNTLKKTDFFAMTRIGILGGSFDPIHYGHLILADTCREHLELDRLLLVPAATSPLKPNGPVASNDARLAMCQLAVEGTMGMEVDPIELDRGGISYTLDTVKSVQAREGAGAELVLLVGSDSIADFDRWHKPQELLQLVQLGVLERGGHPRPNLSELDKFLTLQPHVSAKEEGINLQPKIISMPQMELSSTEIRRRVGSGKSIRFRLPRAVEAYISAHHIYQ